MSVAVATGRAAGVAARVESRAFVQSAGAGAVRDAAVLADILATTYVTFDADHLLFDGAYLTFEN